MNDVVFDASALLTLLNGEKGCEIILDYISNAVINTVNFSEAITKLSEFDIPENDIKLIFDLLNIRIIDFNQELAYKTGLLRNLTRKKGLSLGDRACIATGIINHLPVITADNSWKDLNLNLNIIYIR